MQLSNSRYISIKLKNIIILNGTSKFDVLDPKFIKKLIIYFII